jgi:hypothetical protein
MNSGKRPPSVTVIACMYIAVGTIGFVYHFRELQVRYALRSDALLVELTEALAIFCGVFMLRGHNWARWLAAAWIAFHVILSIHDLREFAIHCLFCAIIVWCLFRPETARYFLSAPAKPM